MTNDWPVGNFVLSLSGGRTSAFLLLQALAEWGPVPDRGVVCFQNTGKEHEKTLEFIKRVEEYSETHVEWIEFYQETKFQPLVKQVDFNTASRNGEPFILAMEFEKWYLPSHQRRWCTKKMKMETLVRHLRSKGWESWDNIVGIRYDEPKRWTGRSKYGRVTKNYPLVEWETTKEDVQEFWHYMPFDLELPELKGRNFLGNCQGCFLKSELDLALLCKHDPEEFMWWEMLEESSGTTFKNGWSYKDLREKVESGFDYFKIDGYFCQANEGECTGV